MGKDKRSREGHLLKKNYSVSKLGGILQFPFISCSSKGLNRTCNVPQLNNAKTPKADKGIIKIAIDAIKLALAIGFASLDLIMFIPSIFLNV
jgi:hypothetical protein